MWRNSFLYGWDFFPVKAGLGLAPAMCAHPRRGRAPSWQRRRGWEMDPESQHPYSTPCPTSDPKHRLLTPKVQPRVFWDWVGLGFELKVFC